MSGTFRLMSDQSTQSAPRRKGRSPAYPAIDLSLAVERAQTLWDHEHHYPTSVATILGHWGYGPKSGGGFAALAALKSFGMALDEGNGDDRRAWLSELGQDIVTTEDEGKKREMIQRAALKPTIHRELWNRFRTQLPSDQSLRVILIRELGFTNNGANELVSEWKRTMAFAGLADDGGTVPPQEPNAGDEVPDLTGEPKVTPPPTIEQERREPPPLRHDPPKVNRERTQRTIQVPYSPTEWALIQASFPMTDAEWDQMLAVLQAMKLGLVAPGSNGQS